MPVSVWGRVLVAGREVCSGSREDKKCWNSVVPPGSVLLSEERDVGVMGGRDGLNGDRRGCKVICGGGK